MVVFLNYFITLQISTNFHKKHYKFQMARTKVAAKKSFASKPLAKHIRSQEAVSRQIQRILPTTEDDEIELLFKKINDNIKLFRTEFVQGNKRIAEDYISKVVDRSRDLEDRLFPFEQFEIPVNWREMEASIALIGEADNDPTNNWQDRFKRMKNNSSICRLHYLRKDLVPLKKNLKKLLRNASFLLLFAQYTP